MHEYVTPPEGAGAKRADKMQFQGVLLAYHIIRQCSRVCAPAWPLTQKILFAGIIMHRSFLIQREIQEPSEAYRYQRGISEAAILDSAMQILDFCRRLIRLGVHLSFWFITSHIQISCLALCEYIQNYVERGLLGSSDLAQPQQGLETAVALLEEIEQSGENPAVVQVLEAVRTIQDAVRPALAHVSASLEQANVVRSVNGPIHVATIRRTEYRNDAACVTSSRWRDVTRTSRSLKPKHHVCKRYQYRPCASYGRYGLAAKFDKLKHHGRFYRFSYACS